MEVSFSSTMNTSGQAALPSSYIDLKYAYIDGTPVQWLDRKSAKWIYQKYPNRSSDKKSSFIARESTYFIFGPFPDSTYTVKGVYYQNLGAVSASNHALFLANPDVYLFGSLYMAVRDLKDDKGIARWQPLYERCLASANAVSEKEDFSGGDLRMVAG